MFQRYSTEINIFLNHHKNVKLATFSGMIAMFLLSSSLFLIVGSNHTNFQAQAAGTQYFVDSTNGDDANDGLSDQTAWKSLNKVHNSWFNPGDTVRFKRGSTFNSNQYGTLIIYNSGTNSNPITYTDYGDSTLPAPTFSNTYEWGRAVFLEADNVVVSNLKVNNSPYVGIGIQPGANHNIVQNIEAENIGIGFEVRGENNLLSNNYAHDLNMVVNTPGGDDDFGAVGFWLYASNNELAYNTCLLCIADSYDYGFDGAGIEITGEVNNSVIHHNLVKDSAAFIEVGGTDQEGRTNYDTLVHHNVVIDSEIAFHFNLYPYQYWSDVQRFVAHHNTVVYHQLEANAVNFVQGELTGDQLQLWNNIFYNVAFIGRKDGLGQPSSAFIHEFNAYYGLNAGGQSQLTSSEVNIDPEFINLATNDFHLSPTSILINGGKNFGYELDFDNLPRFSGGNVDLGAFEYQDTTSPQPSEAPVPGEPSPFPVESPEPSPSPESTSPDGSTKTKGKPTKDGTSDSTNKGKNK